MKIVRSKNIFISIITVLFLLACLEVGIRIFFKNEVDSEIIKRSNSAVSIRPIIQYSNDSKLLFELKPSLDILFLGVPFKTDNAGIRIASKRKQKKPGAFRIALMGDSTSVGWGVRYKDSYAEQCRVILEKKVYKDIEIKNFSVPGYNAIQELRQFITKVVEYKPDLLILHHDHNDYEPIGKYSIPPDVLPYYYGDNYLNSALIKFIVRRVILAKIRRQYRQEQKKEKHEFVQNYPVSGPLYESMIEARISLIKRATKLDIPVFIVIFNCCPIQDDNYQESVIYKKLHLKLKERLSRAGYFVMDLYPRFQDLMKKNGWKNLSPIWRSENLKDVHPNPEGHKYIAQQIVEFILGTHVTQLKEKI